MVDMGMLYSVKAGKAISTIAIRWPVKAIFEKRAATMEVDSFVSPAVIYYQSQNYSANRDLPLPLGRGVCETKSKKGRTRQKTLYS